VAASAPTNRASFRAACRGGLRKASAGRPAESIGSSRFVVWKCDEAGQGGRVAFDHAIAPVARAGILRLEQKPQNNSENLRFAASGLRERGLLRFHPHRRVPDKVHFDIVDGRTAAWVPVVCDTHRILRDRPRIYPSSACLWRRSRARGAPSKKGDRSRPFPPSRCPQAPMKLYALRFAADILPRSSWMS